MSGYDNSPDARLLHACRNKDMKALKQALADGADVNASPANPYDEVDGAKQAAHIAASRGFTEGLELLWLHGANLFSHDSERGNPPLHLAVLRRHSETARFLLDLGADPETENSHGHNVLKVAHYTDKDNHKDEMVPLVEEYRALPKVKELKRVDAPDALWKRDVLDKCYFDNPQTWRDISEVSAHLLEKGTPLTKAHLQQTNKEGKSWLQVGTEHGALPDIVAALNANGEHCGADELLDEKGEPNATLERATRWRQVPALFTYENWRGKSLQDLQQFTQSLPETGREQVPNYHALSSQLQKDARLAARPGIGM